MDAVILVCVMIIGGMLRSKSTGGLQQWKSPVLQADGAVKYFDVESIPVGNNLMLKKEVEPFTFILKQLGLMK